MAGPPSGGGLTGAAPTQAEVDSSRIRAAAAGIRVMAHSGKAGGPDPAAIIGSRGRLALAPQGAPTHFATAFRGERINVQDLAGPAIGTLALVALGGYLLGSIPFGVVITPAAAGGAAFLGHLFPVWLKFKGGKGVATFYGLLLAAAWPLGLMAGAVWLISAFVFRYSSLAALISSATAPLLALLPLAAVGLPVAMPILALTVFAAALLWGRHP